jgi:CheY-like chemotaxis protein
MHGSEVLANLRAQPATAETPVIVISADATPSQIERMLAAGAQDYITKPFEIRRFLLMFDEIFPRN